MRQDKLLWKMDNKDVIPVNVMDVNKIVPYSNPTNLTEQQQKNIIAAFNRLQNMFGKRLSQTLGNIYWN